MAQLGSGPHLAYSIISRRSRTADQHTRMSSPPQSQPPPLPSRPPPNLMASTTFNSSPYAVDSFAGYNSGYMPPTAPYGMGMGYGAGYGGMYGQSMYSPYGGGMYQATPESNFIRVAEESSRNAFQSIEAVVGAVTSVANMLNSTHNAVFSSFRAVLGVVEQFSLMKKQLSSVVANTLLKWIRLIWRRLLVLLRLKPANYAATSDAWTDLATDAPQPVSISWPAIMFWLVALGGPYLIYRCVSQMVRAVEEKQKWATGRAEHFAAEALYDFNPQSQQELGFMKGDRLRVAPKTSQPRIQGWILASTEDGQRIGLVPINYLRVTRRPTDTPPRPSSPQALPNQSGLLALQPETEHGPANPMDQVYGSAFN